MEGILVIGSCNMDLVVCTERLPQPGCTVLGETFKMHPGGKGANQAVAAARLGNRPVHFMAKLGNDVFGRQYLEWLKQERLKSGAVLMDDNHPTGVALITVDTKGENCIVVAPGANMALSAEEVIAQVSQLKGVGIVLLQLEIPLLVIEAVIAYAKRENMRVVLNPAPAMDLPARLLPKIDILTPNEHEAEMLTDIPVRDLSSAKQAAEILVNRGVKHVIITLGSRGALMLEAGARFVHIETPVVNAVDTTAAGDVFNGALAVGISEGMCLEEAARFACRASAISVTRAGAQPSAPYRDDLTSSLIK